MDGPPAQEATHQIEELILEVRELRRRVEALERLSENATLPAVPRVELPAPAVEVSSSEISSGLLAALGRMLLASPEPTCCARSPRLTCCRNSRAL